MSHHSRLRRERHGRPGYVVVARDSRGRRVRVRIRDFKAAQQILQRLRRKAERRTSDA